MNIVNIMNFVRGCEPRFEIDLAEPVKRELELCRKYGYPNTFLFQYDALVRDDLVSIEKGAENTEVGIWIEMAKCLTERVSIKWRGREGYDWDWYVDPGFLPSYTQSERMLLIDEIMRKFKEIFGSYPKSVGSWVIDAFSMEYMQKKYNVNAFGICREEYGVDAYTLQRLIIIRAITRQNITAFARQKQRKIRLMRPFPACSAPIRFIITACIGIRMNVKRRLP